MTVVNIYGVLSRVSLYLNTNVFEKHIGALCIMRVGLLVLNIPQSTYHGLMYRIYIQAVTNNIQDQASWTR